MDGGGQFRASRPANRRAVNRPEQAHRQPEAASPAKAEAPTQAVHRSFAPQKSPEKPRTTRRIVLVAVAIILLALLIGGGALAWGRTKGTMAAIETDKYQAVFFTNGQVYFGKLHAFNGEYMRLTDIYYLQTQNGSAANSENPQQSSNDESNVQLIKLGDEIHGPKDEMVISKQQMLFFENLKDDGKVAQSIQQHKQSN